MKVRITPAWTWATWLLSLWMAPTGVSEEILPRLYGTDSSSAGLQATRSIAQVATSADTSLWSEFFPLHVGDTWVYGFFCGPRQEGTLTRGITQVDTLGGQAYYMTQDVYQPDSTSIYPPVTIACSVRSNYRLDTEGKVYAYEPAWGVELLVFELNAPPSWCGDPAYCHSWLEYEGELPDPYRDQLALWMKEDIELYGGYYNNPEDWMLFSRWDSSGSENCGGAGLRRGIGIVSASCGCGLVEVECGFHLLRAVIEGREYVFKTSIQETTWGNLKGSFSGP